MAVNGVPQPSGSFVTFPPTNQVVTCIPNSQELQMDGVQESKVFVTVAVHPGPTPTAVQPAGSLVAPNGFINGNSIYPPNVQPPPNSQIQTDANYNYMGPTHPINRASPATVKWLLDNFETAEGVSLPRARMYDHYMIHSQQNSQEPVNAASFGKLVRSVFVGLKTRRLGTRGHSKYHYYGIKIKDNSPLLAIQNDPGFASRVEQITPRPTRKDKPKKPESQAKDETTRKRHLDYLGDPSQALPEFPNTNASSLLLPRGVDEEDIELLEETYREHCEAILDITLSLQFDNLEEFWMRFWQFEELDGKQLAREKMMLMLSINGISEWIYNCDHLLYRNLTELLIPDVLRQDVPPTLTQQIRLFARQSVNWMRRAVEGLTPQMAEAKINAVSRFSSHLRRLTSLNHLAREARPILSNQNMITQMMNDLNKIDFHKIQEQICWVTNCPFENVSAIHEGIKEILASKASVVEWQNFLADAISKSLPAQSDPMYPQKSREFILKWSYYSSMVMRDLTLRSAQTFGSFHLIRLLMDELVTHIIDQNLAKPALKTDRVDLNIKQEDGDSNHSQGNFITLTQAPAPLPMTTQLAGIQYADHSSTYAQID